MFAGRYFAARYFAPRYWPKYGAAASGTVHSATVLMQVRGAGGSFYVWTASATFSELT